MIRKNSTIIFVSLISLNIALLSCRDFKLQIQNNETKIEKQFLMDNTIDNKIFKRAKYSKKIKEYYQNEFTYFSEIKNKQITILQGISEKSHSKFSNFFLLKNKQIEKLKLPIDTVKFKLKLDSLGFDNSQIIIKKMNLIYSNDTLRKTVY